MLWNPGHRIHRQVQALLVVTTIVVSLFACAEARFRAEVENGRSLLVTILVRDTPPSGWVPSDQAFYAFKVWFAHEGITTDEARAASFVSGLRTDEAVFVDLRVRAGSPEIRLQFDQSGRLLSMSFPLNNCEFQPDLNGDGRIDLTDVALASTD